MYFEACHNLKVPWGALYSAIASSTSTGYTLAFFLSFPSLSYLTMPSTLA